MLRNQQAEMKKVETTTRFAQIIYEHYMSIESERQGVSQAAQAEGVSTFNTMRAHIPLGVVNGNAQLVNMWLDKIEFGDFNDNQEAFLVSQQWIVKGKIIEGLIGLQRLREHIVQCEEIKSLKHLLPGINEAISNTVERMLGRGNNSAECRESEILEGDNGFPLFM